MRRACLVTKFVRSSSSPTHSHRSNETNHIHHIWRTWWLMITHMSSANFMLNFVHLSAINVFVCLVFSLEMWFLFSKQWKTCVSLHVLNKPRHPLSEPSGRKGLGGQKGHDLSLQPSFKNKKTLRPLAWLMPLTEREICFPPGPLEMFSQLSNVVFFSEVKRQQTVAKED